MMENLVQNNMTALSNMSDADKRDLQQTINNEMQKMKIHEGDEHFPPPTLPLLKNTLVLGIIPLQLSFLLISQGPLQRCTTLQTCASKNA